MRITDGISLNRQTLSEKNNLADFLEGLALWTYEYIHTGENGGLLKRIRASYSHQKAELTKEEITPEEVGIIALASRYLNSGTPRNDIELQELAEYQFQLQKYLGIMNIDIVTSFYKDLLDSVKPEHNKLIPVLHTYHAQIHALKIAYEQLKPKMNKANLTTRVIFGLICIELMKLHVRLYMIEPMARTQEGRNLDWIYMLDMVFSDFSTNAPYNTNSFRKKNTFPINNALEQKLEGALGYIKEIRDSVAELKEEKRNGSPTSNATKLSGELLKRIRKNLPNNGNSH